MTERQEQGEKDTSEECKGEERGDVQPRMPQEPAEEKRECENNTQTTVEQAPACPDKRGVEKEEEHISNSVRELPALPVPEEGDKEEHKDREEAEEEGEEEGEVVNAEEEVEPRVKSEQPEPVPADQQQEEEEGQEHKEDVEQQGEQQQGEEDQEDEQPQASTSSSVSSLGASPSSTTVISSPLIQSPPAACNLGLQLPRLFVVEPLPYALPLVPCETRYVQAFVSFLHFLRSCPSLPPLRHSLSLSRFSLAFASHLALYLHLPLPSLLETLILLGSFRRPHVVHSLFAACYPTTPAVPFALASRPV